MIGRAFEHSNLLLVLFLIAFLHARRAYFRRLASLESHQMLSFLQSDFRIEQAAS